MVMDTSIYAAEAEKCRNGSESYFVVSSLKQRMWAFPLGHEGAGYD